MAEPTLSFFYGASASILLLCAVAYHARNDISELVSARCVFLITLLSWYLLEATVLPDAVRIYSNQQIVFGIFTVLVSAVGFSLGYTLSHGTLFNGAFKRLIRVDNPTVIWFVFLIAIFIGFLPLLVIAEGNPVLIIKDAFFRPNRWDTIFGRGRYGGFRDAFLELRMFSRAAVPLAGVILVSRSFTVTQRAAGCAFLIYMAANAITEGTRAKVLEVLMPVIAAVYWGLPVALKRAALCWGLPALFLFGYLYSAASVLGRNTGSIAWDEAGNANYVGFEMFRELLFLQDRIPSDSPYRYGLTYYVQMVNPIPRAIWPGKPDGDAGLLLAEMQGAGAGRDAYLTVSPGLIGEMHWNFGPIGVALISAFLGYLARSWDAIRDYAKRSLLAFVVFSSGLAIIFLSGRSINMSTLYGMMSLYAILIFTTEGGFAVRRS